MTTKKICPTTKEKFTPTHGGQKYVDGKARIKYYNDIARNERHRRSETTNA